MEDVAQRIGRAMDGLDGQFAELDRQEIWLKMGDILTNISDITDGLNDPTKWQEIVANLHSMTEGLTDIGTRFDSTWERVDEGVVKFSSAMDNASLASTDLREIIGDIRDGKGTVGKILTRDDFYLRLNSLMSKADTLMNDINHYGLLFHRERGWQRERTKRMNQVQKLSTPQQFRDFFAEEVDGITTSLGRVHVMMEEADARSSCEDWIDEERFAKVFRELMLQIRGLHDSIELYNSELSSHTCQEACVGE
jgi:phospholipid/cholesterol/gamma-HCH transport system substrate-binding protein